MNDQESADYKFYTAVLYGDLLCVQRMMAEDEALTAHVRNIETSLLLAATGGLKAIPTLLWLLGDGGASVRDGIYDGCSAFLLSASYGRYDACLWLLEHGEGHMSDTTLDGETIWDKLLFKTDSQTKSFTALLRVMVLKGDPPDDFQTKLRPEYQQLRPEHLRVLEEGARIKADLPAYLVLRKDLLNAHCPLIAPLNDLVLAYEIPTTTDELWATKLRSPTGRKRALHIHSDDDAVRPVRCQRLEQ
jgi:hypothetical protein